WKWLERIGIEVIHMGMGNQNQVELLQSPRFKRRVRMPVRPNGQDRIDCEPHPIEQRGISYETDAEEVHQQGGMTEIGNRERIVRPACGIEQRRGRWIVIKAVRVCWHELIF